MTKDHMSDVAQSVGMREALEDTANWLEGCLNCKTWSWDGLQRDAAEKALEGARAILASQPSPAETESRLEAGCSWCGSDKPCGASECGYHRQARGPLPRLSAGSVTASDLKALYEWMREPDWAEEFSINDMAEWINKRPSNTARLLAEGATIEPQAVAVTEALEIAEDVLSRAPFSTAILPNGMHPQVVIEKIRAALALSRPNLCGGE